MLPSDDEKIVGRLCQLPSQAGTTFQGAFHRKSQRPAFLHVFLANWLVHMEMAENIVRGLGPEYVAVRPDQLVSLYRQSKNR